MLPDRSSPRQAHRAFTLVEMLVVIGIITILAGLVVVNVTPIFEGMGAQPPERTLRQAVREARYQATMHKETTYLHFSAPEGAFIVTNATGTEHARVETGFGADVPDLNFQFHQILPERGLGGPTRRTETAPVPRVRFQPDRSSTPFEVEITWGRDRSLHRFDPFSAVELRSPE
jgi:prepilin-type N-terminal cleavage/methylation domain-containing protein